MAEFDRVRVATDLSCRARQAVLRAARLGAAREMTAGTLVHVLDSHRVRSVRDLLPWVGELDEQMESHARQHLEELADEVRGETGFSFATEVREGHVTEALLEGVVPGELIVVGGTGHHAVGEISFGSTAERVVRRSHNPVLVVKREPVDGYQTVVVPVDFSDDSRAALRHARELAPGARLYILHAWPPVPREGEGFAGISDEDVEHYVREVRKQAEQKLDAMLEECGIGDDAVQRLMQHGYAASFIWQQARALGADLVVIGKHGHSRLADWLIGSVTTHVLNNCDTDILVTRANR